MLPELPPAFVETEQLRIELVAADSSLQPGGRHWLALKLDHAPDWHTYWINPGDSGLVTKTRWDLPAGTGVGALQWPAPHRHLLGDLVNFGYDQQLLLPIELKLDPALPVANTRIAVDVSWLVCREECIPGKARLALELPVSAGPGSPAALAPQIQAVVKQVPVAQSWPAAMRETSAGIELEIADGGALSGELELFPVEAQVLSNAVPAFERSGDKLIFRAPRSDYFTQLPEFLNVVISDRTSGLHHLVRTSSTQSTQPNGATP